MAIKSVTLGNSKKLRTTIKMTFHRHLSSNLFKKLNILNCEFCKFQRVSFLVFLFCFFNVSEHIFQFWHYFTIVIIMYTIFNKARDLGIQEDYVEVAIKSKRENLLHFKILQRHILEEHTGIFVISMHVKLYKSKN